MTASLMLPFDRHDPLEPPPQYARLRESTPVARVRTPDGRPAWLVTSYDAVAEVLSDRRYGLAPPGVAAVGNDTLFQDGEAHTRLRRLVSSAFGPRSLAGMRPRVERLADGLVAELAAAGPPVDLVSGLATPLSTTVISELLGVSIDDRERFHALAESATAADFLLGTEEDMAAAAQAWAALTAYAAELVTTKRKTAATASAGDVLTALVTARDDEGRLSDAELVAMVTTIVAAGYLSARNAISTAALRLLAEAGPEGAGTKELPSRAEPGTGGLAVVAGEAGVDAVVAELLRLQAGRTGEPFPRYAQEDVELSGVYIAAGDMVLVRLEAAHRDPAHYADPDRFHPGRRSSPPLVFGHGMHYCLGAVLARMELAAALSALARRLPGLRLREAVADIAWSGNGTDTGPAAVPVTWRV